MRAVLVLALASVTIASLPGCFEPAGNEWAVTATQIDLLRAQGSNGRAVRVAILDTGIDVHHPSLRHLTDGDAFNGQMLAYADFVGQSDSPRDNAGHGTYVAGVLAARPPQGVASVTSSGSSVIGLAPEVDLLVGRICATSHCDLGALWLGLDWAMRQEADIISLSLGFTQVDLAAQPYLVERVRQSLREAEKAGVLVVSAAGNGPGGVPFPAREPTVLAVAAMARDGEAVGHGDRAGLKPDLVAPGDNIVGPDRGGGRVSRDGTSAAVPFVVAAAALAMSAVGDPGTEAEVEALRWAFLDTAKPLAGQRMPHDPSAGHGLLQAERAAIAYGAALAGLDGRQT